MSSANILGNGIYSGTIGADDLFKATGTVVIPAGAGPQTSPAVSIQFLKSTDLVLAAYQCGGTIVGPVVVAVANSGLTNASFTLTSTGAVGAGGATMLYMVLAGRG